MTIGARQGQGNDVTEARDRRVECFQKEQRHPRPNLTHLVVHWDGSIVHAVFPCYVVKCK